MRSGGWRARRAAWREAGDGEPAAPVGSVCPSAPSRLLHLLNRCPPLCSIAALEAERDQLAAAAAAAPAAAEEQAAASAAAAAAATAAAEAAAAAAQAALHEREQVRWQLNCCAGLLALRCRKARAACPAMLRSCVAAHPCSPAPTLRPTLLQALEALRAELEAARTEAAQAAAAAAHAAEARQHETELLRCGQR